MSTEKPASRHGSVAAVLDDLLPVIRDERYSDEFVGIAVRAACRTNLTASESVCHRCGRPNSQWSAPSPLWNVVMRADDDPAMKWAEIICPPCFAELAERLGVTDGGWRFGTDNVRVELPTIAPDGRVWDPETWLWQESNETPRAQGVSFDEADVTPLHTPGSEPQAQQAGRMVDQPVRANGPRTQRASAGSAAHHAIPGGGSELRAHNSPPGPLPDGLTASNDGGSETPLAQGTALP